MPADVTATIAAHPAPIWPARAAARSYWFDPAAMFAGCIVFALILFLPPILNDGDTLWQIRTGEWILAHRAIPAADPFSFTAGGRPWFAHEWLAETLMALTHQAAGMRGVMTLAAAAGGLTASVLLWHSRRFLPGVFAVVALVVALVNAAPSMLARPHLLAWPCLVIWCGGLIAARARRSAPSYWLLPVMTLWVNLHGSFMAGLLLPGAFMIEALFDPNTNRRQVFSGWASFILLAWGAALINPEFVGGLLFPFQMLGMKSLIWIGEWQPTDFSRVQPLEAMILAALVLGLSGKLVLPPMRLLMLLGLFHGALSHARNEQLLGLIGVLILAEPLGAALGRGSAPAPSPVSRVVVLGGVVFAGIALATRFMLPLEPARTGDAFAATMTRVPPDLRARPVLNDYSLGGKLIFAGVRPFIDSRADLYGDAFLDRYRRITAPRPEDLTRALSEFGIAWTIFPADHRIIDQLDREVGWHRLTATDGVVIHVKD